MENVDVKEDIKGTSKDAVCYHQVMEKDNNKTERKF